MMAARARGMTLIELVVVLTILGLLTTVAVTATDVLLGQGRYDTTVRMLNQIQSAVQGPPNAQQPDGMLLVAGFVADVGRLPNVAGTDGLAELYANPAGLASFAVRPAPSDPEVLVPCGWRGPYVQLAVGTQEIRDGWGNYFDMLLDAAGDIASPGQPIFAVRSRGADGVVGAPATGAGPYDADSVLTFNQACLNVTVSGNVYLMSGHTLTNPPNAETAGSTQITVKMFSPNPTTGLVLETPATITTATSGVVSYSFAQPVSAGPRFLRAYLGNPPTQTSPVIRFQQSDAISLTIPVPISRTYVPKSH
jgi:prepilin-type N-terminal cleavage/methylation domain-containing protein